MERELHKRTELLLGSDNLERLQRAKVMILGLGGVGSWCAEALVRSGIRNITLVDSDRISATNCNRQLMATSQTIGQIKAEALRSRLMEINPYADIKALYSPYCAETADSFHMEDYDFVIDAIDNLKDKANLILKATSLPDSVTFFSSMGAALKTDPFKVRSAEFWKVKGDPLARAIRKKFKNMKVKPGKKFQCIYSEELPMENMGDASLVASEPCPGKAVINGSLCHVTAIFGMSIAGLVINSIISTGLEDSH